MDIRKRVRSRLTSTYVDVYSENLYQLLLRNAKEHVPEFKKKLVALSYSNSKLLFQNWIYRYDMDKGGSNDGDKKYYSGTSHAKRDVSGWTGRKNHGNAAGGIPLGKWWNGAEYRDVETFVEGIWCFD